MQSQVSLESDRFLSDGGFWFELVSAKLRIGKRLGEGSDRALTSLIGLHWSLGFQIAI